MNRKVKYSLILFIAVLSMIYQLSCSSKKKVQNEVSDEIVLKVGSVAITKYEFEKNKGREYQPGKDVSYLQWLNGYIDETYLLADAYNKKYDTISVINRQLDYVAHSMVAQVEGYLWEKTVTPRLIFSNSELKKVYKKRNKTFYFEFLQFPDKKTMTGLLNGDTVVETEIEFNKLVKKCSTNNLIKYCNQPFVFPFSGLEPFMETLYKLKQGDIRKLSSVNKEIFIIHLLKIENREQKPFKAEKDNISFLLKHAKELQIIDDKQNEVFSKAKIMINEKVETKVLEILKKAMHSKEIEIDPINSSDTLMVYTFNNQQKSLSVNNFSDYYKNNFTLFAIDNKEYLDQALKDYVIEQYLYVEADSLGVTTEKKYLLDKKNFMNRLVLGTYNAREFDSLAHVSDQEIHEYYRQNKQNYTEAVSCNVSLVLFKDRDSAYRSYGEIISNAKKAGFKNIIDISKCRGVISYKPNVIIEKENKEYSQELINKIFHTPVNQLSMPAEHNNSWIMFLKTKQEGARIKTFEEVKDQVKSLLHYNKAEMLKKERLEELKRNYSISIKKI